MSSCKDLSGMKFGKLTVMYRNGSRCGFALWRCKCECGNECDVLSTNLTNGRSKSCGCETIKRAVASRKKYYSEVDIRLASIYRGMMKRCYNKHEDAYPHYGGRGITICPDWKGKPENFLEWAKSNGYSKDLSIDRIDVDGPYSPHNCRWATKTEQANNKRNNKYITVRGETHTIAQWAHLLGINRSTLDNHVYQTERHSPVESYISSILDKRNHSQN